MPVAIPLDELKQEESLRNDAATHAALEPSFDRITSLAAQIFDAPMSAITLVDGHGQRPKSTLGRDRCDNLDEHTFCASAVSGKKPLIVLDPLGDLRFRDNPLVTGRSAIRFYVAAPLLSRTGSVLGALSVADTKVRLYVSGPQLSALKDLAAISVFELEQQNLSSSAF